MKARRALTMVELVLTMSIALVLATVAISGLVGVQSWRASTAVRRIGADLAYARATAMLSSCRTLCTFDVAGQQYTLEQEPQPASGKIAAKPLTHPLSDAPWQVSITDLGGGTHLDDVSGLAGSALGFGADGCPLQPDGKPLTKDARLRFAGGVEIVVRGGSGVSEIIWP
ncbi:MAG: type II secretion system protein [Phycisphaerae bacterium]|jgi:Tfp pilus assembly protein FimT